MEIFRDYRKELKSKNYDIYIITTNGVVKKDGKLVMGAGIAKIVADAYPTIQMTLGVMVSKYENTAQYVDLGKDSPNFISFPTKRHFLDNSSLGLIKESAEKIVDLIKILEDREGRKLKILCPRPGCKNGNLEWKDVQPILDEVGLLDLVTIISEKPIEIPIFPEAEQKGVLAITGHRPPNLFGYKVFDANGDFTPDYVRLAEAIGKQFKTINPSAILTGMALGVDQIAAYVALRLKIPYIAYIPYEGFGSNWPEYAQSFYNTLLESAQTIRVLAPSSSERGEIISALDIRNKALVKNSQRLLAVHRNVPGGTANCLRYAREQSHQIYEINVKEI